MPNISHLCAHVQLREGGDRVLNCPDFAELDSLQFTPFIESIVNCEFSLVVACSQKCNE